MGISGILWKEIGDGKTISLAAFAAEHFEKTGKPLRLAVDAPTLYFQNVNKIQTLEIRQISQRQSHPTEKNIIYFISRIERLGIRPLFVFDGPNKPSKKGRKPINSSDNELYKKLLTKLGVPVHDAPAEAEAECARLQMLGYADAVYSNDGDVFTFGCTKLIRKCLGDKSTTHVRLYESDDIEERIPGLNRDGFAIYCLLDGGDYSQEGIKGIGHQKAVEAIKHVVPEDGKLLPSSLRESFEQNDMAAWRTKLLGFLNGRGTVPSNDRMKQLCKYYMEPLVSNDQTLRKFRTDEKWNISVDEKDLYSFLFPKFNVDAQDYISWVLPILLARKILRGGYGFKHNLKLAIEKPDTMKKADGKGSKVSFLISAVTSLDMTTLEKKDQKPGGRRKDYVHKERVQDDFLDYVIECVPLEHRDDSQAAKGARKPRAQKNKDEQSPATHASKATVQPSKKRVATEMNSMTGNSSVPVKRSKPSGSKPQPSESAFPSEAYSSKKDPSNGTKENAQVIDLISDDESLPEIVSTRSKPRASKPEVPNPQGEMSERVEASLKSANTVVDQETDGEDGPSVAEKSRVELDEDIGSEDEYGENELDDEDWSSLVV